MAAGGPKQKRARRDDASELSSLFHSSIRSNGAASRFRSEYIKNKPYSYGVLSPLCSDPNAVTCVRDEIVHNLESAFKETDLFKLYQTTDLANITPETHSALADKLPKLLELREALYSPAFRNFVGEVTGCGKLTDRVDMAASAYSQGSHLLCHDDVIGTRAVSFIIYFTDEEWKAADGGALELYPLIDSNSITEAGRGRGIPDAIPSARVLPLFNTMAFFVVEPGLSYHSVQEVFTDSTPRLSIQGWYHRTAPPMGSEMASIYQLKSSDPLDGLSYELISALTKKVADSEHEITNSEKEKLAAWISPTYLELESVAKIRARFEKESTVQLLQFLKAEKFEAIQKVCRVADFEDGVNTDGVCPDKAGVQRAGWTLIGPPHMRRYLRVNPIVQGREDLTSSILLDLQKNLFETDEFASWLWSITGVRPTGRRSESRRFRSGLDYVLAHHGQLEQESKLDATICFVDDTSEEAKAVWQSGDIGGFHCYIAAEDEETTAAEVYVDVDAEENQLVSLQPTSNVLCLVLRNEGTMSFIKYVSALAMGSRWDVFATYEVDPDDVGSVDNEEEENTCESFTEL